MSRTPDAPVDDLFVNRWSPRAFAETPVAPEVIRSVFEAARWAPSAFNAQPWRFVYAASEAHLPAFRGLLNEWNQKWASAAPVVGFVLAERHFEHNGKPNGSAAFDAGAAWMSLALQARLHGLYTHAMGGIHVDAVYDTLGIDREAYTVMCGFVMGHRGDAASLPDDIAASEAPNGRKPLAEIAFEGRFPSAE